MLIAEGLILFALLLCFFGGVRLVYQIAQTGFAWFLICALCPIFILVWVATNADKGFKSFAVIVLGLLILGGGGYTLYRFPEYRSPITKKVMLAAQTVKLNYGEDGTFTMANLFKLGDDSSSEGEAGVSEKSEKSEPEKPKTRKQQALDTLAGMFKPGKGAPEQSGEAARTDADVSSSSNGKTSIPAGDTIPSTSNGGQQFAPPPSGILPPASPSSDVAPTPEAAPRTPSFTPVPTDAAVPLIPSDKQPVAPTAARPQPKKPAPTPRRNVNIGEDEFTSGTR